jgi:hypothetical protein
MVASMALLQFLLMLVGPWLQRQQAAAIEYLQAENCILRARLGGRRIIFTDAERSKLAEKARALGQGAARAWHDRHARYAASLAPGVGGAQMDLR